MAEEQEPLTTDPARVSYVDQGTGIYVRALSLGQWSSVDIAALDARSLLQWLRSRGGDNPYAENTVGILLGHGPLHKEV